MSRILKGVVGGKGQSGQRKHGGQGDRRRDVMAINGVVALATEEDVCNCKTWKIKSSYFGLSLPRP